jgi:hypothetical protein
MLSATVRPRLRPDVLWRPVVEGLLVFAGERSVHLSGSDTGALLDRVAPLLTGELRFDEMTAGLNPQHIAAVSSLFETLLDEGFIRDDGVEDDGVLTPEERARFRNEIEYIDFFLPSAATRFRGFRDASIHCLGSGPVQTSTSAHLRDMGNSARAINIHEGPAIACVATNSATEADRSLAALPDTARVLLCLPTGAEEFLVGPVGGVDRSSAQRLLRTLVPAAATDRWLTGPMPSFLGSRAALMVFRIVTGIDTADEPSAARMTTVNVRTFVSREFVVDLSSPGDPAADRQPGTDDLASLLARLAPQPTFQFEPIVTDRVSQLPVPTASATVTVDGRPESVHGWGNSLDDAVHDAAAAALQLLARTQTKAGGRRRAVSQDRRRSTSLLIGTGRTSEAAIADGLVQLLVQCTSTQVWADGRWLPVAAFGGAPPEMQAELLRLEAVARDCDIALSLRAKELLPGLPVAEVTTAAGVLRTDLGGALRETRRIVWTNVNRGPFAADRLCRGTWTAGGLPVSVGSIETQLAEIGVSPTVREVQGAWVSDPRLPRIVLVEAANG